MFWLIETSQQLEDFYNEGYKEVFIEIIPLNYRIHPAQNKICALFIAPLYSTKSYMTTIDHNDTFSLGISAIVRLIDSYDVVYTRDKKEFLHYFVHKNIVDLTFNNPYIPEFTKIYNWFYNRYSDMGNLNKIIPIVKHYEYCEKIYEDLKFQIGEPINLFYNNKVSMIFNSIERNGLKINKELYEKHFHPTDSDYIYTQYNIKTTTARPSNKFGGVNYAALNKENGERECFIPRNDTLIEFDIKAYHPSLLSKLVKYEFQGDIHQTLADLYGVSYSESKKITFHQLYGGIFKQYKDIEFFRKVQNFIDELWFKFETEGYIECPISNHKFERDKLENMNPQKLLNYLLQNLESSMNVVLLEKIIKIIRGKNTKLILYTYDAFLFDFDESEEYLLKEIEEVFNVHKLNFKINSGTTYNFSK